jgi:hypothetical protein
MKWLTIYICLLSFCLMGFSTFSNEIDLTGRLRNKTGSSPADVGGLRVFVMGNQKIMAKGKSNARGVFHLFWNDDPSVKTYYFYCILDTDTIPIGKVHHFDSQEPDLTFYLPDM